MGPARSQVLYLAAIVCLVFGLFLPFARFRRPMFYNPPPGVVRRFSQVNTAELRYRMPWVADAVVLALAGTAIAGFWLVRPAMVVLGGGGILATLAFLYLALPALSLDWLLYRLMADPNDVKVIAPVAQSVIITYGFHALFLSGLIFIGCGLEIKKELVPTTG